MTHSLKRVAQVWDSPTRTTALLLAASLLQVGCSDVPISDANATRPVAASLESWAWVRVDATQDCLYKGDRIGPYCRTGPGKPRMIDVYSSVDNRKIGSDIYSHDFVMHFPADMPFGQAYRVRLSDGAHFVNFNKKWISRNEYEVDLTRMKEKAQHAIDAIRFSMAGGNMGTVAQELAQSWRDAEKTLRDADLELRELPERFDGLVLRTNAK